MKKIFLILFAFLFSCTSSEEKTIYTLKFVVFYPGYKDTIVSKSFNRFSWTSLKGTNDVYSVDSYGAPEYIYSNTAPFKILSYTKKKLNDNINTK